MLSDIREDSNRFGVTFGYNLAKSGDVDAKSMTASIKYRPLDWFLVSATVPFTKIKGQEEGRGILDYSVQDWGDATVMGWSNLAYFFLDDTGQPAVAEEEGSDPLRGTGDPAFYVGLGLKLDTGTDDEFDYHKAYMQTRLPGSTGEISESFGILHPRFQTGTGTEDLLVGAVYQQRFGHFQPSVGVAYQMTGGENSVGYERSNKFSWALAAKYMFWCNEGKEFAVRGGISGLIATEHDVDHSENVFLGGSQKIGSVDGTKDDWLFWSVGVGYDLMENLSLNLGATFPLGHQDSGSEYAFDHQYSMSLEYRF